MKETFELTEFFNVPPSLIYNAWLNSDLHSKMTGGEARCSKEVNGAFTAWNGYIWGKNISLKLNKEIIQSWRTSEFGEEDEDSVITIKFKKTVSGGTEFHLIHKNIPSGQTQYYQGWKDHYLNPMKTFFSS